MLLLAVHGRGGVGRHDFRVVFRSRSDARIGWSMLPAGSRQSVCQSGMKPSQVPDGLPCQSRARATGRDAKAPIAVVGQWQGGWSGKCARRLCGSIKVKMANTDAVASARFRGGRRPSGRKSRHDAPGPDALVDVSHVHDAGMPDGNFPLRGCQLGLLLKNAGIDVCAGSGPFSYGPEPGVEVCLGEAGGDCCRVCDGVPDG